MGKRLYREYDEEGNLIKLECSNCGEIKTVDNFHKSKVNKDGVRTICKSCFSVYRKNHYIKNKDKIHENYIINREKKLEQVHQYQLNNKDKIKERRHKYYLNNKDEIKERKHKYYLNNRDEKLKKQCEYRLNNKDKVRETNKQYYLNNIDKRLYYARQYNINNKDKKSKYHKQYYIDKANQEISKIYENVTKNLYPNNNIQYGIIYGVHCKVTNRWYIGQTTIGFKNRYDGNFFNCKNRELSENSEKGKLLHEDIEKYGKENFEIFEVLDVAFSEKELDEKEAYYIDYYKAYDEGYNSNRGNIFKHNKSKRKEVI